MTREQVNRILDKHPTFDNGIDVGYDVATIDNIINRIYDDFESRVCENCKYYLGGKILLRHFSEDEVVYGCNRWDEFIYQIPDKDFGCNKFERRNDGI